MFRFSLVPWLVLLGASWQLPLAALPFPDWVAEDAAEVSLRATPGPGKKDILYVDVRTPEEYARGHVPGAINLPHDQMSARWPELAAYRNRPIVLYCRSGRRSQLAWQVLKDRGFRQVKDGGGLDEMAERGHPLTAAEPSPSPLP